MRKDMYNGYASALAFGPAVLDADNTPPAIDLQGFRGAQIQIDVGVGGITFTTSNKVEFKLTHSDDNVTYTAVTIDDVVGLASVGDGGIIHSLTAAHAAATSTLVSYVGGKRYLKLLADFSGTHAAGTPMCGKVLKGMSHIKPIVS